MKYSAAIAVAAAATANAALQPIVMKGTKFFYENGTQFFMKGIAYQQDTAAAGATNTKKESYIDPLADVTSCKRDVPLLKELGINTIRTYAINPEKDHSACMKLLDDAGIYVISDLSEPSVSINRDEPAWNTELYKRYTDVVDELSQYDNVIGFFAGNEVSNNKSNTPASAYVKAAVRDTKLHVAKLDRWFGVGYAANDDADIREEIANYFNCGESDEERIDYWGYNIYSWCGESNMEDSGYSAQAKFFSEYSIPVFFAEYGCNKPGGANERIFQETTALYEDEMTEVFSGGIVYMYFQEENDYGVVKVKNGEAVKQKDFNQLKKRHAAVDPTTIDMDSYSVKDLKPATCPAQSSSWKASSDLPPTPDSALCDCMVKTRECVPASNLKEKDFKEIFDYICGADKEACKGIQGDAEKGVYGAYSMCDEAAKLAYVLDAYYQGQDKAADACDFDGQATTQSPKSDSSCDDGLAAASSINEEVATATAAAGSGGSTGAASSDSGDDGNFGTQVGVSHLFGVGAYMIVAGAVGAAMIAL